MQQLRDPQGATAARLLAAMFAVLGFAAGAAETASEKDPIAKYQADLSAGAISASEILGLTTSAVTTIQSPKDFVAALNAQSSDAGKAGFGLAFTPARTSFAPVSIADYTRRTGSRIWAGTTFSYAQNTKAQGGVDYRQEAYAARVAWYLNAEDDPYVAGFRAFANCDPLTKLEQSRGTVLVELMGKLAAQGVPTADLETKALAQLPAEMNEKAFLAKASRLYKECVDSGIKDAKDKWNASQVALMVGEGRIRNPVAGATSLSLGRSASLAVALGPNKDSLVNITVRRTDKALDVSTIAGTPVFKSSNLVGARWTYRAMDTEDLYALAEISNAKAKDPASSGVFKVALGVDKRLSEGLWVELRLGRNRTQDGLTEQTTALMSLKFSGKSNLLSR
jgi:hypothetical protein